MNTTEVLYARVDITNMLYLEKLSKKTGKSKAQCVDEILKSARLKKQYTPEKKASPAKGVDRRQRRIATLEARKNEYKKSKNSTGNSNS